MIHEEFCIETPFAVASMFETADREEALDFAANVIAPMNVVYGSSGGKFEFRVKATKLIDADLISHMQHIENGAAFDVQYEDSHMTLEVPIEGNAQMSVNGASYLLSPNKTAALFSHGQRATMRDPGNRYRAHSYKLDRRLVERRFRQLIGSECVRDIIFEPVLDLATAEGGEFLALASMPFLTKLTPSSVWNSRSSAALFEELLINILLTSFRHSRSSELNRPVPLTSTSTVKKCEEYLEAHAEEAITIGGIAQAIGVSVRSLQRTFRKTTGSTPMRRLKEIRLERARTRLICGDRGTGVTQVALSLGFSHLGAFAADYKARFGESPSQTYRRSL